MDAGAPGHPSELEASIGGYMGSSFSVALRSGALEYTRFDRGYEERGMERIEPTDRQWRAFRDKLERWGVWNWCETYSDPDVMDPGPARIGPEPH